ncbi:MAG: CDP-alcohol phosphatidyltransferase family protein [Alphaproteobacteria bacterium]|nr:CDP-alcohol phosphatidyltransferase family protein [Alphaproteobacteria bacterium]
MSKTKTFFAKSYIVFHKIYAKAYNFFNLTGSKLGEIGVKANWVSWLGFIIGIFAINFLAMGMFGWALFAILLNRVCDALDGAIARATKITNFGVFLDAALDYIFYGGVIWGFAMSGAASAASVCFLMFGFSSAACSMLAYSVVAYKMNSDQELNIDNSPFYLGGLAQGSETFVVFIILCLFPGWFVTLAIILGILSLLKAFSIIVAAYYNFVIAPHK